MKTIEERMKNYIVDENGCWNWLGCKNNNGYGKSSYLGNQILAHRLSWIIYRGVIPAGMVICHKCDNPSCINPDHLFLGTSKENMQDCVNKGRHNHTNGNKDKKFCKHGHPFNEENTYYTNRGERSCRVCGMEFQRRKYGYRPRKQ